MGMSVQSAVVLSAAGSIASVNAQLAKVISGSSMRRLAVVAVTDMKAFIRTWIPRRPAPASGACSAGDPTWGSDTKRADSCKTSHLGCSIGSGRGKCDLGLSVVA